jgi:hypothetical protein
MAKEILMNSFLALRRAGIGFLLVYALQPCIPAHSQTHQAGNESARITSLISYLNSAFASHPTAAYLALRCTGKETTFALADGGKSLAITTNLKRSIHRCIDEEYSMDPASLGSQVLHSSRKSTGMTGRTSDGTAYIWLVCDATDGAANWCITEANPDMPTVYPAVAVYIACDDKTLTNAATAVLNLLSLMKQGRSR